MTDLRISTQMSLPVEVVGESTAILAKKGAGKSNTAKVIVEETLDHGGVQVVVLDPLGHWWSLRAGADGKPKGGYPVAVFGGIRGDLPLEPAAGKLLAQTAVESGQSMILDVSLLDSNGAMQRFAYEFAEELYRLKQAKPTALLLVLEEADEFAPQDTRGENVPRMVGVFNRIVKRGRGRGIGTLVVTQRSAALNKNVLDQSDSLIVMRTIGPRDRAAIEGWIKYQQADGATDVIPSLPGLATGEGWIWMPERSILSRVKIRKVHTFDSTSTPKPGEAAVVANVKPINLEALGAAIQATVERAKENDPAELRKRNAELERAAAGARRDLDVAEERIQALEWELENQTAAPAEPVITAAQAAELHNAIGELIDVAGHALEISSDIKTAIAEATTSGEQQSGRGAREERGGPLPHARRPEPHEPRPAAALRAPVPPSPALAPDPDGRRVSRPQQTLLDTLAWFEAIGVPRPSRTALGFLARVSPRSSGFEKNLSTLRTAGLLEYPSGGLVCLTDGGRAAAASPAIEVSDEAMQRAIYDAAGPTRATMLRELVACYPHALSREELADRVGASSSSSGFEKNLSTLRSQLQVIDYPAQGMVAALPILFPVSGR